MIGNSDSDGVFVEPYLRAGVGNLQIDLQIDRLLHDPEVFSCREARVSLAVGSSGAIGEYGGHPAAIVGSLGNGGTRAAAAGFARSGSQLDSSNVAAEIRARYVDESRVVISLLDRLSA